MLPPSTDDSDESPTFRLVTFTVLDTLRGEARLAIQVRTRRGSCSPSFVVGRQYLVYASRDRDRALTVGMCSRSRPIDRAADDLAYGRGIQAGAPALGRISGRVVLRSRDLARSLDREQPMPNVSVILKRGEFSANARTDASGAFVVDSLDAGSYALQMEYPGDFRWALTPPEIVLADVRGCATVNAVMHPNGAVTGRVVTGLQRPIAGLTLDLTVRTTFEQKMAERLRAVTRRDGTFEFKNVPPGRFVVGIHTRSEGSLEPLPKVFHPGVLNMEKAAAVILNAGGRVEIGDLVVPPQVSFSGITGLVYDSSGAPAEGVRVYLRGPSGRDHILSEPVLTDFLGRFTIAAAADRRYIVFAERDRPGTRQLDISTPVLVTTDPALQALKLTLRRP